MFSVVNQMSKKANLIYKIITIITLVVPLPVYMFLSATLFNIIPDYTINNVDVSEVMTLELDEYTFIYTDNTEVIYDGVVVYNEGNYGFYVDEEDIIKIDNDFYSYNLEENGLIDIEKFEMQKQTSYKLPLTFFLSGFGVLIVVLVVQGKMQWYKKYPRLSAFVALLTGTVLLYILNTVIGNILNVFLIATISWAVYCLEYYAKNNLINTSVAEKESNDILSQLNTALKERK